MAHPRADDLDAGQLADYEDCGNFEGAVERYPYQFDDVINFNELQKFAAKARKLFPNPSPAQGGDAASLVEPWQRIML
jgi:hypothetical protein